MSVSAIDLVPLTRARANLCELADRVEVGAQKIISKNAESYLALIDAERLDYRHPLERECIRQLLIDDAMRGLEDVAAGRTKVADAANVRLQQRRTRPGDAAGKGTVKAARQQRRVAEPPLCVALKASFMERLEAIEAFRVDADAAAAFNSPLAELRPTSLLRLHRFPRVDRRYLDQSRQSPEVLVQMASSTAGRGRPVAGVPARRLLDPVGAGRDGEGRAPAVRSALCWSSFQVARLWPSASGTRKRRSSTTPQCSFAHRHRWHRSPC